jgi:hypothetical protein
LGHGRLLGNIGIRSLVIRKFIMVIIRLMRENRELGFRETMDFGRIRKKILR